MHSLKWIACASIMLGTTAAGQPVDPGQPYGQPEPGNYEPGGYYGGYPQARFGASTAAEGYSRGFGDLIRAQGEYNLLSSQAAINLTEAQRQAIENRRQWTQTYFDVRRMNKEARAAARGPRRSREDWVRYAQAGKPKPLSPSDLDIVTGTVNWPILLRSDGFAEGRAEVERAFAQRAANGITGADEYVKMHRQIQSMLAGLQAQVRELPPAEYMTAKRFLQSLAYQAGQPAG